MLENIKRAIAHRLGFITPGEHRAMLEKNLKDFRRQAQITLDAQADERLALFAENKRLRDELADAKEYIEYLKREAYALAPKSGPEHITVGDF